MYATEFLPRLSLVAFALDLAHPLDLAPFDFLIDLQDFPWPLFRHEVFVDADDGFFTRVELLLIAVGSVGNLLLRIADLNRADDPPQLVDTVDVSKRILLHLVGQRL